MNQARGLADMRKYIKALAFILPLLTAIVIQYIVVIALNLIYMGVLGFRSAIEKSYAGGETSSEVLDNLSSTMSQSTIYLFSVIAIIVCGVVFFFWYRQETCGEVRGKLGKLFTKKNIVLFILLGIGCQFFVSGIMGMIQPYFTKTFENYTETIESLFSGKDIIVLLLLVFVAPVAEELIFRGMILHRANSMMPFLEANLMQAVLFGVYHGNIVQGIYATALGFLLGLVYRKFNTIYAPIFLHMIVNASSLLMLLLPKAGFVNIILVITGGVLAGAAIRILMPFHSEKEQLSL